MRQVERVMLVVALVTVGAATLVPGVGVFVIAPALALLLGITGGWWALQTGGAAAGRLGAEVGLVSGVGALAGTVLCFGATALAGGNAAVAALLRGTEPDVLGRLLIGLSAPLGVLSGLGAGVLVGLVQLAGCVVGGLLAVAIVRERPVGAAH